MLVTIQNRGPEIVSTNFWRLGVSFVAVSLNAGCYRVLVPRDLAHVIEELAGARRALVRRRLLQAREAFEFEFDDGSSAPFVLQTEAKAFLNGVPDACEIGRERALSVWIEGDNGQPRCVLELPCWYVE